MGRMLGVPRDLSDVKSRWRTLLLPNRYLTCLVLQRQLWGWVSAAVVVAGAGLVLALSAPG